MRLNGSLEFKKFGIRGYIIKFSFQKELMENKKRKKTKKEQKEHEERMKLILYKGKVNLDIDLDVLRDRNGVEW